MKAIFNVLSVFVILMGATQVKSIDLVCPPDKWLNCGAEVWDLDIYGHAYYYHNGHQYNAGSAEVIYDLTTCETGKIYRTWKVEDEHWNWIECTQTIHIGGGGFSYHHITWPENDLQLYGCGVNTHPDYLPTEYGRPSYDYMTCSMVGTSYKDQVFNFGPDCKKILRTWTVLDWCNYNTGNSNPGIWKYTQTIKVSGTSQPDLVCAPSVTKDATSCDSAYVSVPLVSVDGQACYGGYGITNDSRYADANGADASGVYPVGKTTVNYRVEYSCGEQMICKTDVIVKQKGPVAYCLAKLTVALMGVDTNGDGAVDDGMVELWAKDLDHASYHPCNNAPLKYSFSSDVDSTSRTFTCADNGYNDVQLWITDVYGRQAWCAVTVIVQNNAANIPDCVLDFGGMPVNGDIIDAYNEPLEDVHISLRSRSSSTTTTVVDTTLIPVVVDSFYSQSGQLLYVFNYEEEYTYTEVESEKIEPHNLELISNSNGRFGTEDVDMDRRYRMRAYKKDDISKIDQTDIDILKAYLNEEYVFTNMYSFLAADVNEDGYITFEDLSILTELYNGEEDEWPRERQWVFYNSEDLQSVTSNPLDENIRFQIVMREDDYYKNMAFTGVMKGNLNEFESSFTSNGIIESRSENNTDAVIYPNPFTETITIENPSNEEMTVSIFSLDGKLIYSKKTTNNSLIIQDASQWQPGSFFYSVVTQSRNKTGKLIKM